MTVNKGTVFGVPYFKPSAHIAVGNGMITTTKKTINKNTLYALIGFYQR